MVTRRLGIKWRCADGEFVADKRSAFRLAEFEMNERIVVYDMLPVGDALDVIEGPLRAARRRARRSAPNTRAAVGAIPRKSGHDYGRDCRTSCAAGRRVPCRRAGDGGAARPRRLQQSSRATRGWWICWTAGYRGNPIPSLWNEVSETVCTDKLTSSECGASRGPFRDVRNQITPRVGARLHCFNRPSDLRYLNFRRVVSWKMDRPKID
jgi:hypothetical protein